MKTKGLLTLCAVAAMACVSLAGETAGNQEATAATGDAGKPGEVVPTATKSELAGIYDLVSVDGHPVPCVPRHQGQQDIRIDSSILTLNADGTFVVTLNYGERPDWPMSRDFKGTFDTQGAQCVLSWEGNGDIKATFGNDTQVVKSKAALFLYRKASPAPTSIRPVGTETYRGSFAGHVVTAGQPPVPMSGITVELVRIPDALAAIKDLHGLLPLPEFTKAATDASGAFRFDGLSPGVYGIKAATETALATDDAPMRVVTPRDGPDSFLGKSAAKRMNISLELLPAEPLAGHVVGPDGRPAVDAEIYPVNLKGAGESPSRQEAYLLGQKCGDDGRFSFPKLKKGLWQFAVSANGAQPVLTDWFATNSLNVEIRIPPQPDLTEWFRTGGRNIEFRLTPPRFRVLPDAVIRDLMTGHEWLIGPNQDMNYNEAEDWMRSCRVAGGGWRMPRVGEVFELYRDDVGITNIDPVFNLTGNIWGHSYSSSNAWRCQFVNVGTWGAPRTDKGGMRALAVRGPVRLKDSAPILAALIAAVYLGVFLSLRFLAKGMRWPVKHMAIACGLLALVLIPLLVNLLNPITGPILGTLFTLILALPGAALWNRSGWRTIPALGIALCLCMPLPFGVGAALGITHVAYYMPFGGTSVITALCASGICLLLLVGHVLVRSKITSHSGNAFADESSHDSVSKPPNLRK